MLIKFVLLMIFLVELFILFMLFMLFFFLMILLVGIILMECLLILGLEGVFDCFILMWNFLDLVLKEWVDFMVNVFLSELLKLIVLVVFVVLLM